MANHVAPAPVNVYSALSRPKAGPSLPILNENDWLLHTIYTRQEFNKCQKFIDEQLEKNRSISEHACYLRACIYRHEGKVVESLHWFQRCSELRPLYLPIGKQIARSFFLLGRHRQAAEAYEQTRHRDTKTDWDVVHHLGICYLHLGEIALAQQMLTSACENGHHPRSYERLAEAMLAEGNLSGATTVLEAATKLHPTNANLLASHGLALLKEGRHQEAFERLGAALAHSPKIPRALLAAGAVMQSHREYDVALEKFKQVASVWPDSSALWNNVGLCLLERRKHAASIGALRRACALGPLDWKALFNLGFAHLLSRQPASAFHFLSAAVNIRNKAAETRLLLALSLRLLGFDSNALHVLQEAQVLDPNEAAIHLNIALIEYSNNNFTNAVDSLRKLAEVHPPIGDRHLLQKASSLKSLLDSALRENSPSTSALSEEDRKREDEDELI